MPIYEYSCSRCGLVVENLQTLIAKPKLVCAGADEAEHPPTEMDRVMFSIPAKRNPRHGEG